MTRQQEKTPDARGHWPRGKRRHAESDTAITRAFLVVLRQFFRDADPHGGGGIVHPGSRRSAAQVVGVSDRTLRRWLSGEDLPPAHALKALRRWYAQRVSR